MNIIGRRRLFGLLPALPLAAAAAAIPTKPDGVWIKLKQYRPTRIKISAVNHVSAKLERARRLYGNSDAYHATVDEVRRAVSATIGAIRSEPDHPGMTVWAGER